MIEAEGLTKRYGPTVALAGIGLQVATVGEPDAGRVSVFGLDPRDTAERVEIRRRLGYLPQELGYHRHFTVAAFLDYVAILKEITGRRSPACPGSACCPCSPGPSAGRCRGSR
jgi:ABC-2 type transport system ATP-binding protein